MKETIELIMDSEDRDETQFKRNSKSDASLGQNSPKSADANCMFC